MISTGAPSIIIPYVRKTHNFAEKLWRVLFGRRALVHITLKHIRNNNKKEEHTVLQLALSLLIILITPPGWMGTSSCVQRTLARPECKFTRIQTLPLLENTHWRPFFNHLWVSFDRLWQQPVCIYSMNRISKNNYFIEENLYEIGNKLINFLDFVARSTLFETFEVNLEFIAVN